MNPMQTAVAEFMQAMNQRIGESPGIRDPELRVRLVAEEAAEFADAVQSGDLLRSIDAICDLLYVTFGASVAFGIDIAPFFEAVHQSNMLKRGGLVDDFGKQLKPHDWTEPDLAAILKRLQ